MLNRITIKELALRMAISERMAGQVLRDIKGEYGIKIVTMSHVKHYLKIPTPQAL